MPTGSISAFISYGWDSPAHKAWVVDLATRLRADGVTTILDLWHAVPGDQLPKFMESAVRTSDFVLAVCTPSYKEKSDARLSGVGYEGDIVTGEIWTTGNHRKFVPVLRDGDAESALPSVLAGKYYVDLRGTPYREANYQDLLATLKGQRPQAPEVGAGAPAVPRTAPVSIDVGQLDLTTLRAIAKALLKSTAAANGKIKFEMQLGLLRVLVEATDLFSIDQAVINSLRFPLELIEQLEETIHWLRMRQNAPIGQVVDFSPEIRPRVEELAANEAKLRRGLATYVRVQSTTS